MSEMDLCILLPLGHSKQNSTIKGHIYLYHRLYHFSRYVIIEITIIDPVDSTILAVLYISFFFFSYSAKRFCNLKSIRCNYLQMVS